MPDFLHPGLLWLGLPLVALPILIHLINLMRHRRVEWAAMEFLLESQKKNSTWLLLKQLLLLAMRMAAVAAVVLIVAQPLLRHEWGRLLGGTTTHHIVLLDDSYSMSDRFGDTSAFGRARDFVSGLVGQAARRPQPQAFTLLRFSRAGELARGRPPDFLKQAVNQQLAVEVAEKLRGMESSLTAAGPQGALEAIEQLLGEAADEERVVYLVSDFRTRQWNDPAALKKTLEQLNLAGAQLKLVHCVDQAHPNLAITQLEPVPGTRAAGVPLFMEVAVTNYGPQAVRQVAIGLEEDGQPRPGEVIEEIPAGETKRARFLVNFPTAGEHVVAARLESDPVEADNRFHTVIDLPVGVPVLLVDGDPAGRDGYFLAAALAPGTVRTGIVPQVELPRYLNANPLEKFHAIYVANVDRIDPPGIEALEKYVRAGGGLAFFLGEASDASFFNEHLVRQGAGVFPAPLEGPGVLAVNRVGKTPDLEPADHPIFRIFSGARNSFLADVAIERYFAVPQTWSPPEDSTVEIIARLRNGAPLAVEQKFGDGRVVAVLTTAAPVWNNWAQNPSFVVVVQELQAYLGSAGPGDPPREVAAPLEVRLDPARYLPGLRLLPPRDSRLGELAQSAVPREGGLDATFHETDASGVYQLELSRQDGTKELRHYAFNVAAGEGDLATLGGEQLASRLKGVRFDYQQADRFEYDGGEADGFNLSEAILYALVGLLLAEQFLAYLLSYHRPGA